MAEDLRNFTLEEAANGLEIVDGMFIRGALVDPSGEKSAHGKLLMLLGVHDNDIAEMSVDEANGLLKTHIDGVTDLQLPLLSYINDTTVPKSPEFLTSRLVDVLRRPERFLGSKHIVILALDRLIHNYTEEQIGQIPQVEWQSWEMRVAESAAFHCATMASHNEAGDFYAANGKLGTRNFDDRAAAVLDAWNVFNPAIARFGYKRIHTNGWSWNMARLAARESAKSLNENARRIYAGAVSEIQGIEYYDSLKPTRENPKQPDHKPVFIGMLPDPEGQSLTIEALRKIARVDRL